MKRSEFLRNIIGIYGIASIRSDNLKQYQKIYLLQSFVRGFVYYKGIEVLPTIQPNDILLLVREPNNKYDKYAIALYHNKNKIGYIPKEKNEILSKILDAQLLDLHAEVSHINRDADTWENVFFVIYALKEVTGKTIPSTADYLTILYTPTYHSLQNGDKLYSKYYINNDVLEDDEEIPDIVEDFYDNVFDDTLENIIKKNETLYTNLDEAIIQNKFVINPNKIYAPIEDIFDYALKLDNKVLQIDNLFDEKGYIVVDINKISPLVDSIASFTNVIDKSGNTFYEILLNP
jgi:hypothetical protein